MNILRDSSQKKEEKQQTTELKVPSVKLTILAINKHLIPVEIRYIHHRDKYESQQLSILNKKPLKNDQVHVQKSKR